jgi:S-adenosylmethionine-diacylglycerol 3-amino-3-carboxypropyl transferase
MKPFFNRLNYSFGNEDWRTERKALNIKPSDRVICITASGDRPLHLLLDDCQELLSVDLNPIQNHLLRLKMAAMSSLDYDSYLAFLGAEPSHKRLDMLEHLNEKLPVATAAYWQKHKHMVAKGVLYQGKIERLTKSLAKYLWIFRSKKIKQLFQFQNIEDQKKFVSEVWDTFLWRKVFEIGMNPLFTRSLLKDPGLYENFGTHIHPGKYFYQRMNDSLSRHLANENLFLSFVFRGKVEKQAYPPSLTREGTDIIRKRLHKISINHANIIDFLEQQKENSIDCFSISDVASYLSLKDYERLTKAIVRAGKPGARFCLREFMSSHTLPHDVVEHMKREPHLEKELERDDIAFVYRFQAGTLHK